MKLRRGTLILGVLVSQCISVAALATNRKAVPAAAPGAQKPAAAKPAATKPAAAKAVPKHVVPKLTAAQIVQKHVAARGGLKAWKGVQTMEWAGDMEVGYPDSIARSARYASDAPIPRNARAAKAAPAAAGTDAARKQVQVPFVLEMKRPGKSRIEIEFAGKTAVQIYDGKSGWMMRPYLNRDDWQPLNEEQTKSQQSSPGLQGPLIDYAAEGTKVAFDSVDTVDGRDAYKLKLTHKDGMVQHVWIDAKSFLDVKVEGTPHRMDGRMRTVWVSQRDFRPVQGLMVPFVQETAVDGSPDTHRMLLKKVALNPRLDDTRFERPRT